MSAEISKYHPPKRYEHPEEGFGEISCNITEAGWRVKAQGKQWLAQYSVMGTGEKKVFDLLFEAENWARELAYEEAKKYGGF